VDTPGTEDHQSRPGRAPGRWQLDGIELDEASGRLQVGDASHVLDHGSYGVLEALLLRSGMVVGKDELLRAGWPGRVVSENSLTKAIGRLRHLLEDPEGELLCTAHGYGYRLAKRALWSPAPVDAPTIRTAPKPFLAPAPRKPGTAARMKVALALLACALLAVIGGFAWQARREVPVAATAPVRAPQVDTASIAVLPFEDLSRLHDQRYFADGLTEELMDRLAKLPQLHVASRTSSFAFRGSDAGVQDIARQLGVTTVLEGSVRREGEQLRITVQLINANTGFHLWSESYDKKMTDLFAVQDDIARSVVAALKVRLLPGQDDTLARHRTNSPAAYAEFMSGQRFSYANSSDNDRRAIAAYERAIALDPEFSTAYQALANLLGGDARWADSPAEVAAGKQRSLKLMDRAIELEPDRADLYLARADFLYYTRHDWRAAQRDLDTAARLFRRRPPELLMRQTRLLAVLGRLDEAIAVERATIAAEPAASWAYGQLGYALAATGRYAEAHRVLAIAFKLRPDDDHNAYYDGVAWLLEGKPQQAIAAFERSGSVFRLAGLAAAHYDAGNSAASAQALQTLITRHSPIGAYQVAQAHAWRGEADEAFHWLDRAAAQEDAGLAQLKFDPMMRRVHADPRYQAWLLRLKLDDASLASYERASAARP